MKNLVLLGIVCAIIMVSIATGCTDNGDNENGETPPREPAPPFTLTSIDDDTFSLSDFSGKVVILDFMYVTCQYCDEEMGHLQDIFDNYPKSKVVIITIDILDTDTEEELRQFGEDYGDDWIYTFDTDDLVDKYDVVGVPKVVIIDQDAKIAYEHSGLTEYDTLSSEIDELM